MLRRVFHHLRLCSPSSSTLSAVGATGAAAKSMSTADAGSNSDGQAPEHIDLAANQDVATFAAGCFWGVELAFQRLDGVIDTKVGYTHGSVVDPTYKQICSGKTGHAEALRVVFDTREVTYPQLLDVFWDIHDPTTRDRQKNDVGTQYRSGIYYHSPQQREQAFASRDARQLLLRKPIVTEITAATRFWLAEGYHQKYLQKGGQCADKGCDDMIRCYG